MSLSWKRKLFSVPLNSQRLYFIFQSRKVNCYTPTQILPQKFKLSRTTVQNLSKYSFSYKNILPECSKRHYSAAIEETANVQPENVIDVQPIQFENLKFESEVTHENLLHALQQSESLDKQMSILASKLSLSDEDIEKRICFAKKIESLLASFFPDLKIQVFGSSVNGFGFKGCDIDMSFETENKGSKKPMLERPDVPLVGEVLCGKVSIQELAELPAKEKLLFIHTVLLEYYNESNEPTIFINAYVPLVRFYHDEFKLKCDLSCSNNVAFANTKLMYLFARLDNRVAPLMMTIRYWAKHVELIGKGLMFNTYTISLLAVYFLQTTKPPILPSAEAILAISDSLEIEDMNDKSFLKLAKILPPSENSKSLAELLKDFFLFYLYFDFTRVVCPLIAKAVPREEFFKDRKDKFRLNSICVQDPMLVSHNVAELVDFKHCRKLFSELLLGYLKLEDSEMLHMKLEKQGLVSLFQQQSDDIGKTKYKKVLSMNLPHILNYKADVSENKSLHSAEHLVEILKKALLFKCESLDIESIFDILKKWDGIHEKRKIAELSLLMLNFPHKFKKSKHQNSISSKTNNPPENSATNFKEFIADHELILCVKCRVSENVWLGRDFIKIDPTLNAKNILELENCISLLTAKQNELNTEAKLKPFEFLCECYISKENPNSSILVNFRPISKLFFNPILGIFLKNYLPNLIQKLNAEY